MVAHGIYGCFRIATVVGEYSMMTSCARWRGACHRGFAATAAEYKGMHRSQNSTPVTLASGLFTMSMVSISCAFDAGNIEVTSLGSAAEPVLLKVRPDPLTELEKKAHMQWFYFRSMASQAGTVRYEITNAGEVSFPEAWPGSQVCVSTDRKTWTRVRSRRRVPICAPWAAAQAQPDWLDALNAGHLHCL